MEIRLIRLFKVADMKEDGTCLLKHIRYGKGANVLDTSLVKTRIKVMVDDETVINFYPEKDPKMTKDAENHADAPYDYFESEDLMPLSAG